MSGNVSGAVCNNEWFIFLGLELALFPLLLLFTSYSQEGISMFQRWLKDVR